MHNLTSLIKAPEVILYDSLRNALAWVKADQQANKPAQEKYLTRLFDGIKSGRTEWLAVAQTLVLAPDGDSRQLLIDYSYNIKPNRVPTISIEFGEQSFVDRALSLDETEARRFSTGEPVYLRRSQATFVFNVVSDNLIELMVLHQLLTALLISIMPELALMGLEQASLVGEMLVKSTEQTPAQPFVRKLRAVFTYETAAPSMYKAIAWEDITLDPSLIP